MRNSAGPTNLPLIGRDEELRVLGDALTRAQGGRGSLVLVSGEAGVGKTRLHGEFRRTHQDQIRSIVGRGFPEDAGIAFGPLADAFRSARRAGTPLWNAGLARSRILSAVLQELRGARPKESFDRPVLFEALLDAVEDAGGEIPFVWVLEDIHWADDSTWEFVKYSTRRVTDIKLMLVATYREEEVGSTHAWWTRLSWLKRDPSVVIVRLGRLGPDEAELLVRRIAPDLGDQLVASIVDRSAGTPLLVEELTNLAAKTGELPPVPEVVLATVIERSRHLEDPARNLLEVAAVTGFEVEMELLGSLRPNASATSLVEAGLLERDGDVVRFRHPLLREAAYERIEPDRRRAIHDEVAAELERRGDASVEHAGIHLERADRPEAALAAIEDAAVTARSGGDVGRAASLGLAALATARRHKVLLGRERGLTKSVIADLFRAGRWSELDPLVRQAWGGREELSPDDRAWLANVMALHLFWSGEISEAGNLVEAQIEHLERVGGMEHAAMFLAQASFIAWFRGQTEFALPLADQAIESAQAFGDAEAQCRARNVYALARYQRDRDRETAVQLHRQNAAFARNLGLNFAEANSLWSLSHYTVTPEDYEAAEAAATRAGTWFAAPARMAKAFMHLIEGRPDEAERVFVHLGPEIRLGIPAMAYWMDIKEAWLFLHRGDVESARRVLEERSDSEGASLVLWASEGSATRGWLEWEVGNFEHAANHFARAVDEWPLGAYHLFVGGPVLLPLHIDALLRLDRRDEALSAIESAEALNGPPERFFAAALATARFRLDPSIQTSLEANSLAAAARWPWIRALVDAWRGELLDDADAARTAADLFEEIGARRGVERAEAVLRRLGVRISRPASGPRALTRRELEVAELVAAGLSNPAIARRLFLSRPTVASHISHILTKLGFSSRTQIAAWIAEQRPQNVDEKKESERKSST